MQPTKKTNSKKVVAIKTKVNNTTKVEDFKKVRTFTFLANEVVKKSHVSTNVSEPVFNAAKESKRQWILQNKRIEKSLKVRFSILLNTCDTEIGKTALKENGLKKEDITISNLMNCYSNLVIEGKKQFFRLVKVKSDKSNLLTFDELSIHFGTFDEKGVFLPCETVQSVFCDFSVLDNGYLFSSENGILTATKKDVLYTFEKVESLSFSAIITKIISLKKFSNIEATKKVQKALNDKLKAKNESSKVQLTEAQKAEKLAKLQAEILKLQAA